MAPRASGGKPSSSLDRAESAAAAGSKACSSISFKYRGASKPFPVVNRGICDTPVRPGQQRGHGPRGDHGGSFTRRSASPGASPAASPSQAPPFIGPPAALAGEPRPRTPGVLAGLGGGGGL